MSFNHALVLSNNVSVFKTEDEELANELWQKWRVRDKGYFYSKLYKQHKWDGFVEFYKKDSGRFLTGLLPDILSFLQEEKKIKPLIRDDRTNVDFLNTVIPPDFVNVDGKLLRDYQIEYVEKIAKHKRGIILAPTSSGKTMTMAAIIKNTPPDVRVLVLANKISLVEQNYDEILNFTGRKDVGKFFGTSKELNTVVCATVQSCIHEDIQEWLSGVQVVIVDEIHDNVNASAKKVYGKLKNASVRVGMSATPFKDDGNDKKQKFEVKGWIGPVIKLDKKIAEDGLLSVGVLQERNILSTVQCDFFKVSEPYLPMATYADAVRLGIVENQFFHNIVKRLVESLDGRTLILVDRIEHGDTLHEMIPNSLWVRGQDNLATRKEIITKLSISKEKVVAIATTGIFSVGISFFCNNLANCSGGKSYTRITQLIGRGLRLSEDKKHLKYFDFYNISNDYLLSHSQSRVKLFKKQGYDVKIYDSIDDFFATI